MIKISDNAIYYTVQQLFQISGIMLKKESVRIIRHPENPEVNIDFSENLSMVFRLLSDTETEKMVKGSARVKRISSFDSKIEVPVMMTGSADEFAALDNGKLVIYADLITISFIMLSRYEEILVKERDGYNRFEFKCSLSKKYEFVDIPIVDEYAMLLRKWLKSFIPNLKVRVRKPGLIPTHDVDFILRFGNFFKNMQTIIGGDLISRKSLSIAHSSFRQSITASGDSKNDPLILAIKKLIEISADADLRSVFYFKGLRKGQKDCTYDVFIPEVRYCMDLIRDAGMQVGMHGGLTSYNNSKIFKREKEDLERVYGGSLNYGRQHFLGFDVDHTISVWQDNGIENDSTLGFAEHEGFRCGTCHEYNLYDLKNDRQSTVRESPLIVMEWTLFHYRRKNIEDSLAIIDKLYQRCQSVEGDFVILWHPHSIIRDYRDKFHSIYVKFIERVTR